MLSRKEKMVRTFAETYIRNKVRDTILNISSDDILFVDEIYRIISERLMQLSTNGIVSIDFIDAYTSVSSKYYSDIARDIKEIVEFNSNNINDIYVGLQKIADTVMSNSENIVNNIAVCEKLADKVEGNVRRKLSMSSIKDEILVYDSILSDDNIKTGTLAVDYIGGYITLYPASREPVLYNIKDIKISKDKGKISNPVDATISFDYITNGYFNSRIFSKDPLFEVEYDTKLDYIYDGDLETSYLVEYNSITANDSLTLTIILEPYLRYAKANKTARVDQIMLYLDPGNKISVENSDNILPKITNISVDKINKTKMVLDNTINIKNTSIGTVERGFQSKPPAVFPTGSYFISEEDVEQIKISITSDKAQNIWFPEKIITDAGKNIIHRFNYFETLVLNNYQSSYAVSPSDISENVERPNPSDMFTQQEINEMVSIASSGHDNGYDEHISMYRYYIGIKNLNLYAMSYKTSGDIFTNNLNSFPKRNIAAIELYVNEIIPDNTNIRYYISENQMIWHELVPVNRGEINELPTRIVYSTLTLKDTDKFINQESSTVYLKINMTGNMSRTPIIKSYAVRIKLI